MIEIINEVLVVAAGRAINDYIEYNNYICQENRNFRSNVKYMAFYHNNIIDYNVPMILGYIDSFDFSKRTYNDNQLICTTSNHSELKDRMTKFIEDIEFKKTQWFYENKIIFLTTPTDPRTIILSNKIENNKKDKTGKIRVPYTQSNRYTSINKLQSSFLTTQLE